MTEETRQRISENLHMSWADGGWLGKAYRDDVMELLAEIARLNTLLNANAAEN